MSKNHHHRKAHRIKQLIAEAENPQQSHGGKVYQTTEGVIVRVGLNQWVPSTWKLLAVDPGHGDND